MVQFSYDEKKKKKGKEGKQRFRVKVPKVSLEPLRNVGGVYTNIEWSQWTNRPSLTTMANQNESENNRQPLN